MNANMSLKELIETNTKIIKTMLKRMKSVPPSLLLNKGGQSVMIDMIGEQIDRYAIKQLLDKIDLNKLDSLVLVTEGYKVDLTKLQPKQREQYLQGNLRQRFEAGDKNVKDSVIITAYNKEGKFIRVIDKETLNIVEEGTEFDSFFDVRLK